MNCGNGRWSNEHAKPRFTLKVPLSLNLAVILASCVRQCHANPISNRELSRANEPNGGISPIGEGDYRANRDFLARHGERNDRGHTVFPQMAGDGVEWS